MGVIYPLRNRPNRHARRRLVIRISIITLLAFAALNGLIALYYSGRTYPRATVAGVSMGNVAYGNIERKAAQLQLLPDKVTLAYEDKKAEASLKDLGISSDIGRTKASLGSSRSWLPVVNLFIQHRLAAPAKVDDIVLQKKAETLVPAFHQAPTNAGLELANARFQVVDGKDGYDLSISRLKNALLNGLDTANRTITAPVTMKSPEYSNADAKRDANSFQNQLETPIIYKAGATEIKPGPNDIAGWFVRSGSTYTLDDFTIRVFIAQKGANAGVRHNDLAGAAAQTRQALATKKPLTLTLQPYATSKTYRYCVGLKGVDAAHSQTFENQLRETYADIRGWSLEGQVVYVQADTACDFTVWLTRADLMPTFGAICDPEWSCRVGPNVVINFTRWQETSPAWKASNGPLVGYRHMVINHETGHWFEFHHSNCPGLGQPAPVMQQQSIDLAGCGFNPWPTANEKAVFARSIGL